MAQPLGEQAPDVRIGEAVIHDASDLAAPDDAPVSQLPELMRERRLAAPQQCCEITHAELVCERERMQQPGPGDVGEKLEGRGEGFGSRTRDDFAQERPYVIGVKALHLAAVSGQLHICTIAHIMPGVGAGLKPLAGLLTLALVASACASSTRAPDASATTPIDTRSGSSPPGRKAIAAIVADDAVSAIAPPAPSTPPEVNVYAATMSGVPEALAGIAPRVYVPNEMSNTVSVIDPGTFKVIDTIKVGSHPQHVAPSWDFSRLYVNDAGLTEIDPRTGKVTRVIPTPMPYNLYFTPDGKYAIVVAEDLNRLNFYDPTTWKLTTSLAIPWKGVDHLDFAADGSYLLATTEYTGRIVKVDLQSLTIAGSIEVGGLPIDVRLAPDGKFFYVTNQGRHGLSIIDPVAMREVGFIATGRGAHGLAISRDTRTLYVSNRIAGTITPIDVATQRVRDQWAIGGSPDMLTVSADGAQLWTGDRYVSTVTVTHTTSGKLLARIPVGRAPHGLTYFPQPGQISLGHNGVYR